MKEIVHFNNLQGIWIERNSLFMFFSQKEAIKNISSTKKDLVSGDIVYFSNHIKFPRFKFRNWSHDKNIKTTRNPEKANVVIIDISYLQKLTNRLKEVRLCKEEIEGEDYGFTPGIYKKGTYYALFRNSDQKPITNNSKIAYVSEMNRFWTYEVNELEQASQLSNIIKVNPNIKFMDYPIFSKILATNMILDKETFWEIYHMLKTKDLESVDLAVEMLTNFNLEKSIFFLNVLLITCGKKIVESQTWNKITFKPVKYFIENTEKIFKNYKYTDQDILTTTGCINMIKRIIDNSLTKQVNHKFLREISYGFVQDLKEDINFPGIKIEKIIFDLDPKIFPNQMLNYVKKESHSRDELGKKLQNSTLSNISKYSDEQE